MLSAEGEVLFEEQGAGGMFTVEENDSSDVGTEAACAEAIDDETGETRPVEYKLWDEHGDDAEMLRDVCCEPVRHLCNPPLCELVPSVANPDSMVRPSPTTLDDVNRPNCMPFEIPEVCCEDAAP